MPNAGSVGARSWYFDEIISLTASRRSARYNRVKERRHESVRARCWPLVEVGIPNRDVHRIQGASFETVTGEAPPEGFGPNYYYDVIGDFLSAQQIPFPNLQQVYQGQDPVSLYHKCNVQWNQAGHRVTAKLVADFLREDIEVLAR